MESPRTLGRTVFDVWLDRGRAEGRAEGHAEGRAEGRAEGHAEGHAEKEAASLREAVAAIARFFARKNLPWDAYARDVQAVSTLQDALDLLTDLSTAPDPVAFLRERFGR